MSVDHTVRPWDLDAAEGMSRRLPLSTYRLQIHADFTFDDACAIVPYLSKLGVSHVFVSPVLQAVPGSTHGYDVIDHSRVSADNGGEDGLRRLAATLHEHSMGLVADVVPNHMAIPTPMWRNEALWSVLKNGQESSYASWFDYDTEAEHGIVLPVLGRPIGAVINAGELAVTSIEIPSRRGTSQTETAVRYFDHVFPVKEGTEQLPLVELLDAQSYRLAYWKVGNDELNYRRFFDVETLAAVRVEDPDVFRSTHETLLRLQREGVIDGYRIDHPDGLSDPRGYLRDLASATGGAWTVVEKILEADERLQPDFLCSGTTGYDAMWRIGGLFHSAHGALALTRLWQSFTGDDRSFETVAHESALEVIDSSLWAEIARLTTIAQKICDQDIMLRDTTRRQLEQAIVALITSMDRYRAYVVPGERTPEPEREVLHEASARAAQALAGDDDDLAALDIVTSLAIGDGQFRDDGSLDRDRAEFMVRFAQTCGPVHAKAVEDTAFYRYNRFVAVNEVGSSPDVIGVDPEAVHDHCTEMLRTFPNSMTTLSTHDTKRSEDVRARLSALTEHAHEWALTVLQLHAVTEGVRGDLVDPATELLVWQTLAGTWPSPLLPTEPLTEERLRDYLEKAMREAKVHTRWADADPEYEAEVLNFATAALHDPRVAELFAEWNEATMESQRVAILGQKLVQLTVPGVPDTYQGNEWIDFSLVDPDNRRPVDHASHAARLDELLAGAGRETIGDDKLWVTHRALGVRARFPRAFGVTDTALGSRANRTCSSASAPSGNLRHASYVPIPTTTSHAFAFARHEDDDSPARVVTVVTRLPRTLADSGGFGDARIVIDDGSWEDVLTGRRVVGGSVYLMELLSDLPVALLVRLEE